MGDEQHQTPGGDVDLSWRDGWPVGSPALCQQVILDDPNGRVLVDDAACILRLNPAAAELFGRPVDEILGRPLSDFLTRASLRVAWRAFSQVSTDAMADVEDIPVDLEVERPDGTVVAVEVGGHRYFDDPDHPGLHLRLRPVTRQRWIETFLTALVSGAPLAACLEPLVHAFDASVPGAHTVLLYDRDGTRFERATGPSLHPDVYAAARMAPREMAEDEVPWVAAAHRGEPVFVAVDDLPPTLRAGAQQAGYRSCWAFPVVVPPDETTSAVVVMLRSVPGPPLIGQRVSVDKLLGLVNLAIERNRSHRRLVRAATHDSLTELLNREELVARLGRALGRRDGEKAIPGLAVMYLDLDRFKPVNDQHGHRFGDELLALVGQRLQGCLRPGDDIARVGGDEFVVLCQGLDDEAQARTLAATLVDAASQPFFLNGRTVEVGASVGIALAPTHGATPVALVDAADRGLYRAKREGRGCARMAPGIHAPGGEGHLGADR